MKKSDLLALLASYPDDTEIVVEDHGMDGAAWGHLQLDELDSQPDPSAREWQKPFLVWPVGECPSPWPDDGIDVTEPVRVLALRRSWER